MNELKEIKVIGLNEAATKPVHGTKMIDVVFNLSTRTPPGMTELFTIAWRAHVFMMKRQVKIVNDTALVTCTATEVQEHIDEINKVFVEVVATYNAHQAETRRVNEARAAQQAAAESEIADLAKKLKF